MAQTDKSTQASSSLVPLPNKGRVFRAERRVRLSDADLNGRLRLDAVARYLQDVAGDDVRETGWGAHEHFWLVRRTQVQQHRPIRIEDMVELTTWSSGIGSLSASRRTTLAGERGGLIETESVWVHLGPDLRPRRMEGDFFEVYGPSAGGRKITPRLELADPSAGAEREPWPLRFTDLDVLGHLNNAAYWQAVEETAARKGIDLALPLEAVFEFRRPIDLEERVELVYTATGNDLELGLAVNGTVCAVACVRVAA